VVGEILKVADHARSAVRACAFARVVMVSSAITTPLRSQLLADCRSPSLEVSVAYGAV
jgi:hypothetical protein